MGDDFAETELLLKCEGQGDRQKVLAELFLQHRDRLRFMVQLRLDRRLQGRIDPSDVLQEAYLEASQRLGEYLKRPPMPLFLWLRRITGQKLLGLHRHHLEAQARDARREIALNHGGTPEASSVVLAARFLEEGDSPSRKAMRAEAKARIQEALERMDPIDREVLVLRHFEELSNNEVARLLGIKKAGASLRYVRALKRLKKILVDQGGNKEPL